MLEFGPTSFGLPSGVLDRFLVIASRDMDSSLALWRKRSPVCGMQMVAAR